MPRFCEGLLKWGRVLDCITKRNYLYMNMAIATHLL